MIMEAKEIKDLMVKSGDTVEITETGPFEIVMVDFEKNQIAIDPLDMREEDSLIWLPMEILKFNREPNKTATPAGQIAGDN